MRLLIKKKLVRCWQGIMLLLITCNIGMIVTMSGCCTVVPKDPMRTEFMWICNTPPIVLNYQCQNSALEPQCWLIQNGERVDIVTDYRANLSRYYDPAICRFINADSYTSTGQGLIGYNMFAYCGNSPINMSDLFGMVPKFVAELFEDSSLWVPTAAGLLRYVTEYTKKGELYEYWVNGDGHIVHAHHPE